MSIKVMKVFQVLAEPKLTKKGTQYAVLIAYPLNYGGVITDRIYTDIKLEKGSTYMVSTDIGDGGFQQHGDYTKIEIKVSSVGTVNKS